MKHHTWLINKTIPILNFEKLYIPAYNAFIAKKKTKAYI